MSREDELVDHIHLWTDGSITTNPGGTIGLGIFIESKRVGFSKVIGVYVSEDEKNSNQRAELMALVHGIKVLDDVPLVVHLYSDSTYVINGISSEYETHADLWDSFRNVHKHRLFYINPIHVKGHEGTVRNELVDNVANIARKNEQSFEDSGPTKEILEKYGK